MNLQNHTNNPLEQYSQTGGTSQTKYQPPFLFNWQLWPRHGYQDSHLVWGKWRKYPWVKSCVPVRCTVKFLEQLWPVILARVLCYTEFKTTSGTPNQAQASGVWGRSNWKPSCSPLVIVRVKLGKNPREARNAKYLEKEKVVKVEKYYETEVGI